MKKLTRAGIRTKDDLMDIYYYNIKANEYQRRKNGPEFSNFELICITMCNNIDTKYFRRLSKVSYYMTSNP